MIIFTAMPAARQSPHGCDGLRARRIDHALQAEKGEPFRDVPMLDAVLVARGHAAGEGEHAQSARGELVGRAAHGVAVERAAASRCRRARSCTGRAGARPHPSCR